MSLDITEKLMNCKMGFKIAQNAIQKHKTMEKEKILELKKKNKNRIRKSNRCTQFKCKQS